MSMLLQLITAILFVIFIYFLMSLYVGLLGKWSYKRVSKKIQSGKMSDKALIRNYNKFKKSKDSKIIAILICGIFFKSFIKLQNCTFDAYKEGMIQRNLPL